MTDDELSRKRAERRHAALIANDDSVKGALEVLRFAFPDAVSVVAIVEMPGDDPYILGMVQERRAATPQLLRDVADQLEAGETIDAPTPVSPVTEPGETP